MHLSGQYNKIINTNISIQRQENIVMPYSEVLGVSAVLLNSRSKLLTLSSPVMPCGVILFICP
jgi:hypothetical protein